MPSSTWNSSLCKWGISSNLALPMMYTHPITPIHPSKGLNRFVLPMNWASSPKRFLGMCALHLPTHRRPRSWLHPPILDELSSLRPSRVYNWPGYPRWRSRHETTSSSSTWQGGHTFLSFKQEGVETQRLNRLPKLSLLSVVGPDFQPEPSHLGFNPSFSC